MGDGQNSDYRCASYMYTGQKYFTKNESGPFLRGVLLHTNGLLLAGEGIALSVSYLVPVAKGTEGPVASPGRHRRGQQSRVGGYHRRRRQDDNSVRVPVHIPTLLCYYSTDVHLRILLGEGGGREGGECRRGA